MCVWWWVVGVMTVVVVVVFVCVCARVFVCVCGRRVKRSCHVVARAGFGLRVCPRQLIPSQHSGPLVMCSP